VGSETNRSVKCLGKKEKRQGSKGNFAIRGKGRWEATKHTTKGKNFTREPD